MTRKVLFRFSDAEWSDLKGLIGEDLPGDLDAALRGLAEEAITDFRHWAEQGPLPHKPWKRGRPSTRAASELCFLALRLYTHARGAGLTYKKSKPFLHEILAVALDGKAGSIPSAVKFAVRHHRAFRSTLVK